MGTKSKSAVKASPGFRAKPTPLPRPAPGAGKLIDVRTVRTLERRYQVVTMRRDGYTIREIAETLKTDEDTIHRDLVATLNRLATETNETTEGSRQLQIERLDKLLATYSPLAHGFIEKRLNPKTGAIEDVFVPPNMSAAALILTVEARRSKLLALDIPEVKELKVSGIREYIGVDIDKV